MDDARIKTILERVNEWTGPDGEGLNAKRVKALIYTFAADQDVRDIFMDLVAEEEVVMKKNGAA